VNATPEFDVVIVGGGPAGLQAALVLGRARRNVLLCDRGAPRNAPIAAMHGLLSRDGTDPNGLLRLGREQLAAYPSVSLRNGGAATVQRKDTGFVLTLDDRAKVDARRLLLATGVVDGLPSIDGLRERWGQSVFNCPYCNGWEVRDQPVAVLGRGPAALRLTFQLTGWTRDLVLCTNGTADLEEAIRQQPSAHGIEVREDPILRLDGPGTSLDRLVFSDGAELTRRAAFLHPQVYQHSDLAQQLACDMGDDGLILVNDFGQTSMPGVYAVGDAARRASQPRAVAQVLQAAATGSIAAMAIDIELRSRDLGMDLMTLGVARSAASATSR